MKVAISTDSGTVSAHFGRCPSYTLLDIENGVIVNRTEINNPGHATGTIPQFMSQNGVNVMIAGGMGWRAQEFFKQYGIDVILGATGRIDDVIQKIKDGTLEGGESLCSPGGGKGYGIAKEDGHSHE
ncbi:MAG: NifB/NifX family molybdenum-iron cluster-binding protein [Candidatus Lokiarchaeota archaeon]|nr:NifB/NifX family molybdenum-iron cluster-binding protein [Candidatus Lokiarchaeota archaeon]